MADEYAPVHIEDLVFPDILRIDGGVLADVGNTFRVIKNADGTLGYECVTKSGDVFKPRTALEEYAIGALIMSNTTKKVWENDVPPKPAKNK